MKEYFEKKLHDKSDQELAFIRDNPDSMDPDAVAVADRLLKERAESGEEVEHRHFGREVLNELKAGEFGQSIAEYLKEYSFKTVLATIIPTLIVQCLLFIGLGHLTHQTDFIWILMGLYALGIPMAHYFYKIFHKKTNDLFSRFAHGITYLITFIFLIYFEAALITTSSGNSITFNVSAGFLLLSLIITLLLEFVWSLINGVLKIFGIRLW